MRLPVMAIVSCAFLAACEERSPGPAPFTDADAAAVRAALDSLLAAIVRLDVDATLAAYDTSADFAHVFDGDLVRGRSAYDEMIAAMFPGLRAIDDAAIDSAFVVPAGSDAAIVVAAFHETVVDSAGGRLYQRGMWTNLFVRRPAGWKIRYAHSSHVALPTP